MVAAFIREPTTTTTSTSSASPVLAREEGAINVETRDQVRDAKSPLSGDKLHTSCLFVIDLDSHFASDCSWSRSCWKWCCSHLSSRCVCSCKVGNCFPSNQQLFIQESFHTLQVDNSLQLQKKKDCSWPEKTKRGGGHVSGETQSLCPAF